MSDQNTNQVGSLLKQLRLAKKLTQEALAEKAHCDKRTIIRVEQGQASPSVDTFRFILHALGTDESEFFAKLYNIDMRQFNNDFEEIWDLSFTNNHQTASTNLDALKDKDYCNMDVPVIKQAILLCEAVRQSYLHKNYITCFDVCCEALQVTVPNILAEDKTVNCKKVVSLAPTVNEYRVLNIIANLKERFGQQQQALDISSALVVSLESDMVNYSIKKKVLPLAYSNFTHRLLTDKLYAKALEIAERGLHFSRKVKEFGYFNGIMCHKGTALYYMGDTKQAKICLKQAYDGFVKHGNTEYAEIMRESAKMQLGIDIC